MSRCPRLECIQLLAHSMHNPCSTAVESQARYMPKPTSTMAETRESHSCWHEAESHRPVPLDDLPQLLLQAHEASSALLRLAIPLSQSTAVAALSFCSSISPRSPKSQSSIRGPHLRNNGNSCDHLSERNSSPAAHASHSTALAHNSNTCRKGDIYLMYQVSCWQHLASIP